MSTAYNEIVNKIKFMKTRYTSLRSRKDDYVFSALCLEANFYKNPELILNDSDFSDIIVDGQSDGGADIILTDPNSEESDLVIGQSKFHKSISQETVLGAMLKMARFYKNMTNGQYEGVNARVQRQFFTANAERSNAGKIHFVFYTSAPIKEIDKEYIEKNFRTQFTNSSEIEVSILFAEDINNELDEWAKRKRTIEKGIITIDDKDNYLLYKDAAVIVNVSAFSIKELYKLHGKNLLSRNLRYHIKGGKLDGEIKDTINKNPDSLWLKNNGITIICDEFRIDGTMVHLTNFSIVNGGQTTYQLYKNKNVNAAARDLWLTCKIIKTTGKSENEKIDFSLKIAKAANAQKAIKPSDMKANAPEQVDFAEAMRTVGVFYQTKRGDEVPKLFQVAYLHTGLEQIGKLCLAAIFQEPCKSRTNPSVSYKDDKYYEPVFKGNQEQMAQICKELLYMDYYFKSFINTFEEYYKNKPNQTHLIEFLSHVLQEEFVLHS